MLTFEMDDDSLFDAASNTSNDPFLRTINLMAATTGFRSIVRIYAQPQLHSKWVPVLESTDNVQRTFSCPPPGVDGLPHAFVKLCDLDKHSSIENSPYHHIVHILTQCLQLKPSVENFPTLFASMGRVWPEMHALLLDRDPRGLLLMSYWFALLRQIDQWWLTTRARSECMRIVAYLSTLRDPAINALLPFPAAFGSTDMCRMWQLLDHVLGDPFPSGI